MEKLARDDIYELRHCAASWEPGVRLLGNVKASTIGAICDACLALMEEMKVNEKSLATAQAVIKVLKIQCRDLQVALDTQTGTSVVLQAANQALKATIANIYDNIKSLPPGHERFALDCIRRLTKPQNKDQL